MGRDAQDSVERRLRNGSAAERCSMTYGWHSQFLRSSRLSRVAETEVIMSDAIRTFRDLDAWKMAMELTTLSYSLAKLLQPRSGSS
jgi:hypothetical protein